jgi:hypothetical protein
VGTALKTLIGNLNKALRRAKAAKETVEKEAKAKAKASKSGRKKAGERVLAVAAYSVEEVKGHAAQVEIIEAKLRAAEKAHKREREMRAAQLESTTRKERV